MPPNPDVDPFARKQAEGGLARIDCSLLLVVLQTQIAGMNNSLHMHYVLIQVMLVIVESPWLNAWWYLSLVECHYPQMATSKPPEINHALLTSCHTDK